MLDNLVYLVAFMSVLFISLGILSLAEETILTQNDDQTY